MLESVLDYSVGTTDLTGYSLLDFQTVEAAAGCDYVQRVHSFGQSSSRFSPDARLLRCLGDALLTTLIHLVYGGAPSSTWSPTVWRYAGMMTLVGGVLQRSSLRPLRSCSLRVMMPQRACRCGSRRVWPSRTDSLARTHAPITSAPSSPPTPPSPRRLRGSRPRRCSLVGLLAGSGPRTLSCRVSAWWAPCSCSTLQAHHRQHHLAHPPAPPPPPSTCSKPLAFSTPLLSPPPSRYSSPVPPPRWLCAWATSTPVPCSRASCLQTLAPTQKRHPTNSCGGPGRH